MRSHEHSSDRNPDSAPGLSLRGRERRLTFRGNCLDVLQWCEAMCCRKWDVELSPRESESGEFEAERICRLSSEVCTRSPAGCASRRFRLKRGTDGSCVYLRDNRCSIYERRPRSCRTFNCRGGWNLTSAFPCVDSAEPAAGKDEAKPRELLRDNAIFVLHPLLRLITLFYARNKGLVVFVVRRAGACAESAVRERFHDAALEEKDLLDLVRLFEAKESLLEVRRRFTATRGSRVGKAAFDEAVSLLIRAQIIVNAEAFYGTLAGMPTCETGETV